MPRRDSDRETHHRGGDRILWLPRVTFPRVEKQQEKLYHAVLRHVHPKHSAKIRAMKPRSEMTFEEYAEQRGRDGYERGFAEGLAKSAAKGQLNMCRILLYKLLKSRSEPLPDELRQRIDALNDGEHMLTCLEVAMHIFFPNGRTI